jgi:hypothetical protein
MTVMRFIAPAVICAAIATPVSADVTLHLKRTETDFGGRVIDSTEYRKGPKVRTDSSGSSIASQSMIVDAGTGRVVMLWHDGKTAEVFDARKTAALLRKGGAPEVKQSFTATVQSRQIAGWTCTVYDFTASFEYAEMKEARGMPIVFEGSMCLVKNGPGQADFSALYRAESALGVGSTDEIHRQVMELGVPFATKQTVRVAGEMTKEITTHTSEVISVSTAPISDSIFDIPPDYTVIQR